MSKPSEQGETSQQRAFADIMKAKFADAKNRWQPLQRKAAAAIASSGEKGSFEREHATGQASTDSAVAFSDAARKLDETAGATGEFGNSGNKLGITDMGNDAATSRGLGEVRANQNVDDARISGLETVTALGRGEQASAVNNAATSAAISGEQARSDAELSLARKMGYAGLAGKAIGAGVGYGLGRVAGGIGPNNDIAGVNGSNAMDKFLQYGTSGD